MEPHRLNSVLSNMCSTFGDLTKGKAVFREFQADENLNEDQNWQEGYNSIQLYGKVVYEEEFTNVRKSSPIIIKLMSKSWHRKFSSSFSFINEMNFFTKVVPGFNTLDQSFASLFPKFFHGEMIFNVEGDQSVIIFENLNARGYRMSDKKSFLDYRHLILMMRKLGQFHAFSYKAKKHIADLFHPLANSSLEASPFLNRDTFDFLTESGRRGLHHLEQDPAYAQYVPRINEMIENANEFYERTLTGDGDNPKSIIIHGDYMRSNVMFKYEDNIPTDVIIIDMATYRYGSPVLDLALALYINADQETRTKYWDLLIDEYYAALGQTFPQNEIPTKEEILSEFVGKSFSAYLIASMFLQFLTAVDDGSLPDIRELGSNVTTTEDMIEANLTIGGESATRALGDILRDMIDRGFICK